MTGKLVRDRIPEIIEASGASFTTRVLLGSAFVGALRAKLDEEIAEYDAAPSLDAIAEELVDVVEVVRTLAAAHGIPWEYLEQARVRKKAARGGFGRQIWLEATGEDAARDRSTTAALAAVGHFRIPDHYFVQGTDPETGAPVDRCAHLEGRGLQCGGPRREHLGPLGPVQLFDPKDRRYRS